MTIKRIYPAGLEKHLQTDGRAFVLYTDHAAKVAELEEHIEALTDLDKFDISASKAGVHGTIQGAGAGLLASILAKPLFDLDAENYVEQRFNTKNPKTGETVYFIHTTQKVVGKSPHEKRVEAERDRDRLKAKVAELEAAQGWRDIKDAPKDGTVVLAYDQPNDLYVVVYWTSSLGGFWQACDDEFSPEEPTHWQHLPNRPAAPATTKEG